MLETVKWEYALMTYVLMAIRDESPLFCSGGTGRAGRFGT